MSYGAFVHHSLAERRDQQAVAQRRRQDAYRLIRDRMPDMCRGRYVDGYAVKALLELWTRGGQVTPRMVRERRRELIRHAELLARQHRIPIGATPEQAREIMEGRQAA